MKKDNIVKKTMEFENIMKNNRPYKATYFNIYIINNQLNKDRFGISVTKKTGNAVTRNKIKRQIKDIIDDYQYFTSNKDFIIITKPDINKIGYQEIKTELVTNLDKILKETKNEKNN